MNKSNLQSSLVVRAAAYQSNPVNTGCFTPSSLHPLPQPFLLPPPPHTQICFCKNNKWINITAKFERLCQRPPSALTSFPREENNTKFLERRREGWRGGKRDREGRGKEKGPHKSAPKRAVERLQTAQVHQSHSIDDKLCYRLDDLSESERNVERTEGEDGEE